MVSLLPPASSMALKEWAVACNALRDGEQIVILRKGGIHRDDNNFSTEFADHPEFLLFPTYLHQTRDLVKPEFHDLLERSIAEDDVPDEWSAYIEINSGWFEDKDSARSKVGELAP